MTDPDLIRGGQGHLPETISRCGGGCILSIIGILVVVAVALAMRAMQGA